MLADVLDVRRAAGFKRGWLRLFVLGPHGQVECERERDCGPVVRIALGDAFLSLRLLVVVFGGGLPLDRHDLDGGKQLSFIEVRRPQVKRPPIILGCERSLWCRWVSRH